MLTVTRKVGEGVTLDGPGEVRLLKVKGNRVLWGIVAPSSTGIARSEIAPGFRRVPKDEQAARAA
jgi:carbon storage regulator CsrA